MKDNITKNQYLEFLIGKYVKYISNITWHLSVNESTINAKENGRLLQRISDYNEILADLRRLQE